VAGEANLTIGQVARRTGVSASALRYYESVGLIDAPRRRSGRRAYDDGVFEALRILRLARDAGFTLAEIRRLLEASRSINDHTTEADANWVEEVIATNQHWLRDDFRPTFVMEDFKEGNVVFERPGATWRVSGLFDLMGAHFGDSEADLSRTSASYFDEHHELAREFILTYLSKHAARPGFVARYRIFMLLDRMIIWEFVQRHEGGTPLKGTTLRAWVGRYVDLLSTIAPEVA